jgi:hypothetical protein
MKITLEMSADGLMTLNDALAVVDTINFANCPKEQKSAISVIYKVRRKVQLKALDANSSKPKIKLKLEYYEAEALQTFINSGLFNRTSSPYIQSTFDQFNRQLHQKLQ